MRNLLISAFLVLFFGAAASANLVTNGDFQAGDTGFVTGLTPGSINDGAAYYSVIANPWDQHKSAASYFDHTIGTADGRMMAINGRDAGGPELVWQQTVIVTPNATYDFSAWVSSWYSVAPADLSFRINNSEQLSFTAPSTTGLWQNAAFSWTADPDIYEAVLSIVNTNYAYGGNDFALDDISFKAVPVPAAIWLLVSGIAGIAGVRRFLKV